jgi:hypothetical protein
VAVTNDFLDRRRYEITNGLAARNPVSDIARGNLQMAADGGIGMGGLQTAAVQDAELDHLREIGKTMPAWKLHDVVLADQENEFGFRLAGLERLNCVDGVGRRGAFQLHGVQAKLRFAFDGGAQHFHADLRGRRLLRKFVRRDRSRNEDQAIQIELLHGITCQDQMPVMNRIESAAENADLFQSVSYSVVIPGGVEESLAFFRR